MRFAKIIFTSILVLFILLPGCKKCNELATLSFSSPEKNIIPYTGNDTIMVDLGTGTDMLKASGRYDYFLYYNENTGSGAGEQDCKGDYYYSEVNGVNFITLLTGQSAMTMSLDIEYDNPFTHPGIQKYLNISIGATYEPEGFFHGYFPFGNDSIFVDGIRVFYHDSLMIGGKHFSRVYELYHETPVFPTYIVSVYYVISEGIVAAQLDTDDIWFFYKKP